jgi:hypothetical protein
MARLFIDGFETGDTGLWSGPGGGANWMTASSTVPSGMSGTYTGYCATYHGAYKTLSASKSELYFAFKYYYSATTSKVILSFKDSASTQTACFIRNITTGLLEFRLGSESGTLLATGTALMTMAKTYLIEVRYKPLNAGGVFTTKIDGIQDINYSGDTTNGLEDVQTFCFGYNGGDPGTCYFDDIVVDDANWIGNTKIGIIVPEATGTTNSWTASAGNAWACIDEKPPVDTDYVSTNTTNAISTYGTTTISGMNSVKCVQLQARAAYESSPTPTKIQLGVRAGADYFATDIAPPSSFGMISKILELNPADSAAFEQADIDGLELGIKAVA